MAASASPTETGRRPSARRARHVAFDLFGQRPAVHFRGAVVDAERPHLAEHLFDHGFARDAKPAQDLQASAGDLLSRFLRRWSCRGRLLDDIGLDQNDPRPRCPTPPAKVNRWPGDEPPRTSAPPVRQTPWPRATAGIDVQATRDRAPNKARNPSCEPSVRPMAMLVNGTPDRTPTHGWTVFSDGMARPRPLRFDIAPIGWSAPREPTRQ